MKREHIKELTGLVERILSERETSPPTAPLLLTVRDVARCLQTNTQAVYRLAREGKLRAIKLSPRTLRWTEDAVMAFIAGGGIESETPKTLRVLRATG